MNKKILSLIVIIQLLICISSMSAQTTGDYNPVLPQVVPQTPQAAAFARYGEYPVSYSTGVPEISIPIYTIETKDIKLPLSISYHAAGIKVEDIATPVGLGWTLNWGGSITRAIYGVADTKGYANNTIKSESHVQALMQQSSNDKKWRKRWASYLSDSEDSQSDRYVYNFNDKVGVFRYNSLNNEIVTIPYAPLFIEETDGGFKIKDTDGLVYYFGDGMLMSEWNGKDSRKIGDYLHHVSAWYVTKIKSQLTGTTINYKYKSGSSYIESTITQTRKRGGKYTAVYDILGGGYPHWRIREDSYTWDPNEYHNEFISNFPQLLDEITWDNHKIKFNYSTDRLDKYKDRLNSITISTGSTIIKTIVFDNNSYWGNNAWNYRMRLDNIEIKGGNNTSGEKYAFRYNEMNLPDYKCLNTIGNQQNYICMEDYWGYYNGGKDINQPTGMNPNGQFIPKEYTIWNGAGSDRNPNENYMQSCILKEIEYPTRGTTVFEYEANRVAGAYDYRMEESVIGGLRVKNIISKTNNDTIRKSYEYSGYSTQMIKNDMFQYNVWKIYSFYLEYYQPLNTPFVQGSFEWQATQSYPLYSITGRSSSPVFYDTVTEYIGSPIHNGGKKVYKYMENTIEIDNSFSDYVTSGLYEEVPRFWSANYNFDQGLLQPLLKSEEIYEFSGNVYILRKGIYNEYKEVKKGEITCGVRLGIRDGWVHNTDVNCDGMGYMLPMDEWDVRGYYYPYSSMNDFFTRGLAYYNIMAFRYFYLLDKSTTTEYNSGGNISTISNYIYDIDYRLLSPNKIKVANSNGASYTTEMKYPFDYSVAPYTDIVSQNILSPVIEQSEYKNDTEFLQKKITNYKNWGNNLFAPEYVKLQTKNQSVPETRITYHNYDSHGNPVYLSKDNADKVVYVWGYNFQYPIAEIKNATYAEVETAVKSVFSVASMDALSRLVIPNETKLKDGSLQTALPNAQVTTFTYKPLVGIETITDPRGVIITYHYDDFGRLKYIKDENNKTIENYDYHYKNQ